MSDYSIVKKWVKLQLHAMHILENSPDLLHLVKYEDILYNKEEIVADIHDFIGDRRFGGVTREASVLAIVPVAQSINQAKNGAESVKAHTLSVQFQNLCRGDSFTEEQMAKWKHPETGLKENDLTIIESIAFEVMEYFGYETAVIHSASEGEYIFCCSLVTSRGMKHSLVFCYIAAVKYTKAEIDEFEKLNEEGIDKMYEELKKENIEDYNRRVHQAEVLGMEPTLLSDPKFWLLDSSNKNDMKKKFLLDQIKAHDIVKSCTESGILDGFGTFMSGAASQQGYYPNAPLKQNQDSVDVRLDAYTNRHYFAVYDGHGPQGELCSQMCKDRLGELYNNQVSQRMIDQVCLEKAHAEVQLAIEASSSVNAELSGSTSAIVTLQRDIITVAYVGDSSVVLGSKTNTRPSAFLTVPHDCSCPNEYARIEKEGGLIMTPKEYDVIKDYLVATMRSDSSICKISSEPSLPSMLEKKKSSKYSMSDLIKMKRLSRNLTSTSMRSLGCGTPNLNSVVKSLIREYSTNGLISCDQSTNSVKRIWSSTSTEKVPGCAFTRSLGDTIAKKVGVSANPEFKEVKACNNDIIVIASDGVTECKFAII